MKKIIWFLYVFIFCLLSAQIADAQLISYHDAQGVYWIGRYPSSDPIQFQYTVLTSTPPLSTGMPFDVLIGYIYLDSIVRTVPLNTVDSFYKQLGYSDTLRQAVKYIYEMNDFDPIIFEQYVYSQRIRTKSNYPNDILKKIYTCIKKKYPDSLKTTLLLYSADYILDIKADWVSTIIDTTRPAFFSNSIVTECEVLDTIKGKHRPGCIFDSLTAKHGIAQPQSVSSCLEFSYLPNWSRTEHVDALPADSGLVLNGRDWIQKDSEYIVFLQLSDLGRDSTYNYSSLNPLRTANTMAGMYPVRGGIVYDPNNDFGFGTGLTASQFKSRLRSRIYSITHP